MRDVPFDHTTDDYEMFIDLFTKTENQIKINCVTKDKLLNVLNKICLLEKGKLYEYYLTGKLNTNCPFPTWDIDMIIVNKDINDNTELKELMSIIKENGLADNLNIDVKFLSNIEDFLKGFPNTTNKFNITEKTVYFDINTNVYKLVEYNRDIKIKNSKFQDLEYYKPLMFKSHNSNNLLDLCKNFIESSILPDSLLMNSGKYEPKMIRKQAEKTKISNINNNGSILNTYGPFSGLFKKSQFGVIYLASEMTDMGIKPLSLIDAIEFEFIGWSAGYILNNQTIKIAFTCAEKFPNNMIPTYSGIDESIMFKTVKRDFTLTINDGWVKIIFDKPFIWDGVTNIIISWENRNNNWLPGYGLIKSNNTKDRCNYWLSETNYPENEPGVFCELPNMKFWFNNPSE